MFKKLNQGLYKPQNPKKYKGDPTNINYRSGYELTFMRWCDTNPAVLEWASEEVVIPYRSLLDEHRDRNRRDGKLTWHRYFVDFYVKVQTSKNEVMRYLVEIKPFHETREPILEGKMSKKSKLYKQKSWIVNQAKWKAAHEYCKDRGMQFKIITEVELYGHRK